MDRLSFDFVKNQIEKEGYLLLESEYINTVYKMQLQCPKGHIFPMSFKVFSKGHRCSYCAGKRQYNVEEVRGFFSEYGYKLLSDSYNGNKEKLTVLGPDGKEYETTLFAFKVQGIKPHNKKNKFKSENETRNIFEDITGKEFPKKRPKWLVNPKTNRQMELDGYCEELKIAFEYDGKQHFKNDKFYSENLNVRHERDRVKDSLCKKNKIRLIRIPYYIKDKYTYIKNEIETPNNYIYIGDPHVKVKNIQDCERLIDYVIEKARDRKCNNIVFMGDLFHSHGMIRMEVQYFWMKTFHRLLKQFKVTSLVGNHDQILGDSKYSGISSLDVFARRNGYNYTFEIADNPLVVNNIGYIPYVSNKDKFLEYANSLYKEGAKEVLVAHQTFTGATYDNGFYAEDGIDPALVPQEHIISGHIHKQQTVGKCHYIGTPKWDTLSDANEDKGIWYFEHNEDGSVADSEFISTKDVVTPISKYTIHEGEDVPDLNPNGRNYLEFIGKSSWITKMKKKYKGLGQIKARPLDRKSVKVDKNKALNLFEYLDNYFEVSNEINKENIKCYLKEIVDV